MGSMKTLQSPPTIHDEVTLFGLIPTEERRERVKEVKKGGREREKEKEGEMFVCMCVWGGGGGG